MRIHRLILSLLCCVMLGCTPAQEQASVSHLVKSTLVGEGSTSMERALPGRVIAGQRADLAFQVAGTLSELPAKEGMTVAQGQLLAKLNARDFESRYAAAKSTRDITENNLERGKKLVGSGTISQVTFEELRNKFEVAKSEEAIAKKALDDTQIIAPFSGLIARVYVDNFQEVQAKEKILTLQDVNDIDIVIDVPERDIMRRQAMNHGHRLENQKLENGYVTFEGMPNQKFDVTVKEYATEADPTTQTYRVRLSMKAPANVNILPGMSATLIMTEPNVTKTEMLLVPATAVAVDAQGKFYVWVIQPNMTVTKRFVDVGDMTGDNIRILSGLKQGERIVTAGVPYLEEGMLVRLYTTPY